MYSKEFMCIDICISSHPPPPLATRYALALYMCSG